jgi:hypothetical protein
MAKAAATTPATFGPPPAHPFVDDPGGVFASDAHRRVLGHLPTPDEPRTSRDLLIVRINEDGQNPLSDPGDIDNVVVDLANEDYLDNDLGLRMTAAGYKALQK